MKLYTLKREQLIRRPRPEVFAFFEKPENLERITPAGLGFELLTPKPILMQTGAVLDYTIRLLGIPVRWTTLIVGYDPPQQFVDVALRSPYAFWHHTHTFVEVEGGTHMTDEVRYGLRFGLLGKLVHTFWVRYKLAGIFDFRAQVIGELLNPAKGGEAACTGTGLSERAK